MKTFKPKKSKIKINFVSEGVCVNEYKAKTFISCRKHITVIKNNMISPKEIYLILLLSLFPFVMPLLVTLVVIPTKAIIENNEVNFL